MVYLSVNKVAPSYEGMELGMGESLVLKAVAQATGKSLPVLKGMYETDGDLGTVAERAKATQRTLFKPKQLTVVNVYEKLRRLATTSGAKSQTTKVDMLHQLLVAGNGVEPRFLARSVQGKLRIGLAEKTVIAALGQAFVLASHEQEHGRPPKVNASFEAKVEATTAAIRTAYSELPSYDALLPACLELGARIPEELATRVCLTPGIPVSPMLAQPTKGVGEVLERLGRDRDGDTEYGCEYKYDGERAQIHHVSGEFTRIYSRNLEDNSGKYPDIASMIGGAVRPGTTVSSFILDSEAVAYDLEAGAILPFQSLQSRKRKAVSEESITVGVCVYAFDLLYLNGESLLRLDFATRRKMLYEHFAPIDGKFAFAQARDLSSADDMGEFLQEAIDARCEGLMVKQLRGDGSSYEPSKRSFKWLKLKKDYMEADGESLADSLDLVPIGAYIGKGKRTGVYGGYLVACFDPDSDEYQSVCKVGTGFSEADLKQLWEALRDTECAGGKKPYYAVNMEPDVWLEPTQVWEIRAADLSISPAHTAARGLVDATKGVALRFPRFIRIRDDKACEQATTAEQIAQMYRNQPSIVGSSSASIAPPPSDED